MNLNDVSMLADCLTYPLIFCSYMNIVETQKRFFVLEQSSCCSVLSSYMQMSTELEKKKSRLFIIWKVKYLNNMSPLIGRGFFVLFEFVFVFCWWC